MNEKKIQKRMQNISANLSSPDVQFQSAALNSFIELISKEPLTTEQKRLIIPLIEIILKDYESSLRTDCFRAIHSIGIKDFSLVSHLFPIMFQELKLKNRFRTDIVMTMVLDLRNSNDPLIQDSIKHIIKNTPEWFDESFLIPIIKNFWIQSTTQSFQFLDKYLEEIKEATVNYPEKLNEVKRIISQKIEEYYHNLKELQIQKEKQAKIRAEQEDLREELRKKEEEIKKKKESENIEMKQKLEDYVKSISNNKIEDQKVTPQQEELEIVRTENRDDLKDLITTGDESNTFTTFTKLGLKRKQKDENNENS